MMGKSLSYAYAEGGAVPVGMEFPRLVEPQAYTEEQLAVIDEANARRIAAEASIAESRAAREALHAANPHIDFSEAGHAAALADAQRYLAEAAARGDLAGILGHNHRVWQPGVDLASPFDQQPVDTTVVLMLVTLCCLTRRLRPNINRLIILHTHHRLLRLPI